MIREPFDFIAFLRELAHIRPEEMRSYIASEMAAVNEMRARQEGMEFDRAAYLRRLRQLREFLEHREVPPDLSIRERASYWRIARMLQLADRDKHRLPGRMLGGRILAGSAE